MIAESRIPAADLRQGDIVTLNTGGVLRQAVLAGDAIPTTLTYKDEVHEAIELSGIDVDTAKKLVILVVPDQSVRVARREPVTTR